MPRLAQVDPATATGRAKELYDGPLAAMKVNFFKSLMASPAAVDFFFAVAGAQEKFGLSAAEREVVQLAVSEDNDCGYCLAAHTMSGKQAGLTEDQTVGARQGSIADNAKYDALAKFAKAIQAKQGNVSDADVDAVKAAGYTDGNIAEVVAAYAAIVFTNYFNHVNQTEVDLPAAPALATA